MALSSEQLEAETLSQIRSRQPSKGGPELVVEGHKKAVKVIKASASAQKTKKTQATIKRRTSLDPGFYPRFRLPA